MPQQLTFDPERHIYRLDGVIIPSVTQIMKPLSDAEYTDIDPDILDKAAKRGTSVHEAVEMYETYGIEDSPPEYQPYFDAYLKWRRKYQPHVISTEGATFHKALLYAGTLDLVVEIGNELYLIDIKTTAVINDMLTSVQLEAYSRALSTHGIYVDKKAILHLKKDGEYEFRIYKTPDIEAWDTFGALLKVRAHIAKYKEAS